MQPNPFLPQGVAFTADGAVDEDYYVKKLGVHPDFVVELKKAIQGTIAILRNACAKEIFHYRCIDGLTQLLVSGSLVGGGATQSATASCTIDLSGTRWVAVNTAATLGQSLC